MFFLKTLWNALKWKSDSSSSKTLQSLEYGDISTICKYKNKKSHDFYSFYPSNRRYLIFSNRKFGEIEVYDTFYGNQIHFEFNKTKVSGLFKYSQLSNFYFIDDDSNLFLFLLGYRQKTRLVLAKLNIEHRRIHIIVVEKFAISSPFPIIDAKIDLTPILYKKRILYSIVVEDSFNCKHCLLFKLSHRQIKVYERWSKPLYRMIAAPKMIKRNCYGFFYLYYDKHVRFSRIICHYGKRDKYVIHTVFGFMRTYVTIMDAMYWHGNHFYCAVKLNETSQVEIRKTELLLNNLENMRWDRILVEPFQNLPINSLTINFNDLLILKLTKSSNSGKIEEEYCQHPLRTPQSLIELAFFSLQRSKFKYALSSQYLGILCF